MIHAKVHYMDIFNTMGLLQELLERLDPYEDEELRDEVIQMQSKLGMADRERCQTKFKLLKFQKVS